MGANLTVSHDSVIVWAVVNEATWTLEELGARVKDALACGYVPPGSARVRAVPDARTIRYYATLGLVDRPALQGRTALYGERHLLQLVAIKRLQAEEGLTLSQVQERLAGLPGRRLRELARVPEAVDADAGADAEADADVEAGGGDDEAPRARRDFWRDVPGAAPEPAPEPIAHAPEATLASLAPERGADHDPRVSALLALELGAGVTLVLRDGRRPDEHDVQALREAAGPLLRLLEDRGLLPEPPGGERSRS